MKKYNLINNMLGWLMFAIAAVTYLLTLEPTASFWDCPEFIAQGFKLEIGHPPGNPIFILAANLASLFAGGDVALVSKCVNAMSALFSAATILLLFWTITHLVKRLVVADGAEDEMTVAQYLVVMGSGICGALAYTWSDTFWFSAVEAEVYAFSSFCTALVFWLILKWENRADDSSSDRWLILIAYVFGISLGVHLLNLLCLPAIALVYYYRKNKDTNVKGSLMALLISFVIIALILWGLEPGFVEVAGYFELFFVNTLGMSYNTGVFFYALLLLCVTAWCMWTLHKKGDCTLSRVLILTVVFLSGMPFFGDSLFIPILLIIALSVALFKFVKHISVRLASTSVMCILMIFVGFMSYGLVLIRSDANLPLDENSPNSPFALTSYLSRDQYGKSPLLYGQTLYSQPVYQDAGGGKLQPMKKEGRQLYAREVKTSADQPDHYKNTGRDVEYVMTPELNMLFPRIYEQTRAQQYIEWIGMEGEPVEGTTRVDAAGNPISTETMIKPTMAENLTYFFSYQLNYMYWRYFMWNFAGRQNDIQGMGEITQGNWISGIPFIDNPRLGDQSLMPEDLTTKNKGHNVFYLLPLLMGIIGLLWQAFSSKRGIEQFWVIFFLFFMTGIAIVLYLNQPPSQPRERDYAYAGSFYAFSIWIGMGVAGLWRLCLSLVNKKKDSDKKEKTDDEATVAADAYQPLKQGTGVNRSLELTFAAIVALIGLAVPLQMVSQTWDDHDRSGRYVARDYGMNYLASVDKNGVIFCNGDNDTFPLWYAQEVEGYRTDVRAVNLSYLATDWYIAQMRRASYDSKPLPMQANDMTYAYGERQYNYFIAPDSTMVPALKMLEHLYGKDYKNNEYDMPAIKYNNVAMPVDPDKAVAAGVVPANRKDEIQEAIFTNLQQGGGMTASQVMSLDIIASSINEGWTRPTYFAMTVPEDYYLGLTPYMLNTGMAYQVTPIRSGNEGDIACNTDKMYNIITKEFRWGGLDKAKPGSIYLDETVRRMVTTLRTSMMNLANDLAYEAANAQLAVKNGQSEYLGQDAAKFSADRLAKAREILKLMDEKLPVAICAYPVSFGMRLAQVYDFISQNGGDEKDKAKAVKLMEDELLRYGDYARFYQSLDSDMYSRLSSTDHSIDQRYIPQLLQYYGTLVDDAQFDKMMKTLGSRGVNTGRIMSFLQAAQQSREPQQPQQQVPDTVNQVAPGQDEQQTAAQMSASLYD